jgi:hypothetical protein
MTSEAPRAAFPSSSLVLPPVGLPFFGVSVVAVHGRAPRGTPVVIGERDLDRRRGRFAARAARPRNALPLSL